MTGSSRPVDNHSSSLFPGFFSFLSYSSLDIRWRDESRFCRTINDPLRSIDALLLARSSTQSNLLSPLTYPDLNEFLLYQSYNVIRRWDIVNDIILWCPNIELCLGYDSLTVPPSPEWWRSLIHTDDRERVVKSIDRFFDSKISRFWCEEYRLRVSTLDHSTPEYITVIDQIHVLRDTHGKPIQAVGAIFNPRQRSKMEEILGTHRAQLMRNIPLAKKSTDELRYQTQLIKTITDNTTSGLFMMDANGHPTFMNPAAEKITGYKLSEIASRPLHYAIHYKRPDGTHYPMEECPVDNSQAALVPLQNQEETFVDKDGRLFPVVWSIAPLEKDSKTVGAVLEFRDVTLEKAAQLEQLKAKLEAEQQLVRAQEADAHRRLLTEFVDYVCHEIRNPLHGIAANMGFLAETLETMNNIMETNCTCSAKGRVSTMFCDIQQFLASIRECVEHQTQITDSVLDLSRLEAGKVELCDEVFDPRDLIHQSVNILRGKIMEKNVVVREELPSLTSDTLPSSISDRHSATPHYLVKGDATRLRQLFVNLLSNAVKFTPPEGRIVLRLEPLVRDGLRLRLTGIVQDNGIGLDESELASLFKRFSQINKKISNDYSGSGLGLSICDQLVKLMNGSIHVESQKGVGSTFRFSVCLSEPSQDEALQHLFAKPWLDSSTSPFPNSIPHPLAIQTLCESPLKSPSRRGAPYSRFKHVLVVEDNLINQKIVSEYLKRLGYIPSVASNGKEAVDLIKESLRITSTMSDSSDLELVDYKVCEGEDGKVVRFDMIIMDIEMPVMDGLQASRRIRELELQSRDSPASSFPFPNSSHSQYTLSCHPLNSTSYTTPIYSNFGLICSHRTPTATNKLKRIPIIALSGNARPAKIAEALEHGIDDYLIKPCNQERLKEMIGKWEIKIEYVS